MTERVEPNGEWPHLDPVPPRLGSLPENPGPRDMPQMVRTLGSALLAFGEHHTRTVRALEWLKAYVTRPEPTPYRDPDSSIHEFDPELRALRHSMRSAVNNPANPLTEKQAAAMLRREVSKFRDEIELGNYRRIKAFFATGLGKAVSLAWKLVLGGGAGWLLHYLRSR